MCTRFRLGVVALTLTVAGAWLVPTSFAQPPGGGRRSGAGNGDMRSAASMLQQQFNRRAPALGSLLPDVSVVDSQGKELRLRALRGKYTVIVFGCLT